MIRCLNHLKVPQQNKNEASGAKCGACIAEERDVLKAELAETRKRSSERQQIIEDIQKELDRLNEAKQMDIEAESEAQDREHVRKLENDLDACKRVISDVTTSLELESGETLVGAIDRKNEQLDACKLERDAAMEFGAQAYYLIVGESPEWSDAFGYEQAEEDIKNAQSLLRTEIADSRSRANALDGLRDSIEEISALFPDDVAHKHGEVTGVSLLDDIRDILNKNERLSGEIREIKKLLPDYSDLPKHTISDLQWGKKHRGVACHLSHRIGFEEGFAACKANYGIPASVTAHGLIEEKSSLQQQLTEKSALCERLYKQMLIARRFLPSDGSFGEDGINAFESALAEAEQLLQRADGQP